jgi:hypothetical protein
MNFKKLFTTKFLVFGIILSTAPTSAWSVDYRILSMPVGGKAALTPTELLVNIEKYTGVSVTELFDEIWGASAGAITAALLAAPNAETGRKYHTALEVSQFLENNFATFWHAWFAASNAKTAVGGETPIHATSPVIRVLTATRLTKKEDCECDSDFHSKFRPEKQAAYEESRKFKLYDFSSDGSGKCKSREVNLGNAVIASCNIYVPPLYFYPTRVDISETEFVEAIDPASMNSDQPVADPTGYFLEQFVKKLKSSDTLTVYFLSNSFAPRLGLHNVVPVLRRSAKTFRIESDVSNYGFPGKVDIRVVDVRVKTTPIHLVRKHLWDWYFKYVALYLFFMSEERALSLEQSIGNWAYDTIRWAAGNDWTIGFLDQFKSAGDLVALNTMAAGLSSAADLKEEARRITLESEVFQSMLEELRNDVGKKSGQSAPIP